MWWLACASPVVVTDVAVQPLQGAPTVLRVTWRTTPAAAGEVAFGADGALDRRSRRSGAATDHEVLLVGIPPDRDVAIEVRADGAAPVAAPGATGPLDTPAWTLTGGGLGTFLLTPAVVDEVATVSLVDELGRVTWTHRDTRGLGVFRARLLPDGSGVVYTVALQAGLPSADSGVVRVGWDGTESFEPIPDLAHDFVLAEDGAVWSLAADTRDGVQGDQVVTEDGQVLWSTFDDFDPVAEPGDDPAHGWTHANALDLDAASGLLLVGLRNLGTIAAVDPDAGTSPWSFGRAGTVASSGAVFVHQHQFAWLGDRFLVFDNDGAPGNTSRVLDFDFDPSAASAPLRREVVADPPLYSFILGDVHPLDGGDLLVTWSVPATVDRIRSDGTRAARVVAPDDTVLGFMTAIDEPSDP